MIRSLFWDLFEKVFTQGIGFLITIVLARLLSPEEFGLIGMILVIITISQVFLNMGFGMALIQKRNVTEIEYSSVFCLNLLTGIVLTLLLYFSSGLIAGFYDLKSLKPICQSLSPLFVLDAFIIVQLALFTKNLELKIPAVVRIIATIISGTLAVILAYRGFGVWSLVTQSLLSSAIFGAGIWMASRWKPRLRFRLSAIKELWLFSSKVFLSGLLDNFFTRIDVIIIGKMYSTATLGFYTRAQSFNNLIVQYTSGSLARVFFPTISKIQYDTEAVRIIYQKALEVISFLVFPALCLCFLCAPQIFILLFSEKWLPAVEYFRMLLLSGYVYPLSAIMVAIISGRGRSEKFLRLEILKKVLLSLAIIVGFSSGIIAFLYCLAVAYLFSLFLNMYFVKAEIQFSFSRQAQIIVPYFLLSIATALLVYQLRSLYSADNIFYLLEASIVFASVYLLLNFVLKTRGVIYARNAFVKLVARSSS